MSLRECEKCQNHLCTCGHEWQKMSTKELLNLIQLLVRVRAEKENLDPNEHTGHVHVRHRNARQDDHSKLILGFPLWSEHTQAEGEAINTQYEESCGICCHPINDCQCAETGRR